MNPEDFHIEQWGDEEIAVECGTWMVLAIRPDGVRRHECIDSNDVGFQTNEHGQIAVLKKYHSLGYAQNEGWNSPNFNLYTVTDTICTLGDVRFFLVKRDDVVYIMGKKPSGACYTLMAITKDGLHLADVSDGFGVARDDRKYGIGRHLRVWRNF